MSTQSNGRSGASGAKKIEWAPLRIPLSRRIQTLCVAFWLALQLCCIIFSLFLLFSVLWSIPMLLYLAFMFFDKAPSNGIGRRFEWARRLPVFTYMRDYFPVSLVKTVSSFLFQFFFVSPLFLFFSSSRRFIFSFAVSVFHSNLTFLG